MPVTFCQLDGSIAGGAPVAFIKIPIEMRMLTHTETINFIVAPGIEQPIVSGFHLQLGILLASAIKAYERGGDMGGDDKWAINLHGYSDGKLVGGNDSLTVNHPVGLCSK